MKKTIIISSIIIFISLIIIIIHYKNNLKINDDKITVQLDKCVDGDTAWFKLNGVSKKYRFLAIDSPEVDTSNGKISKEYVCKVLTESKDIKIEYDKVGESIDKYERELVWVYVNNELLQEKILEKGLAEIKYIYAKYNYIDALLKAENYSKSNKIGIWKDNENKTYNDYYVVTFDDLSKINKQKVLKNSIFLVDNPIKKDCKFIGWKNGNKLFDLSTKIKKDYNLVAKYEC